MRITKQNIILFLSVLFLSFTNSDCTVNYSGIYTASVDAETDAHIRFYADGVVLVSTSVKNTKDVNTWFNKENIKMVLSGKYKLKGCKLSFKVKGDTGEQSFKGTLIGSSISVTVKDAKTKQSTDRSYKLVEF
jgi:hypothetical protein